MESEHGDTPMRKSAVAGTGGAQAGLSDFQRAGQAAFSGGVPASSAAHAGGDGGWASGVGGVRDD